MGLGGGENGWLVFVKIKDLLKQIKRSPGLSFGKIIIAFDRGCVSV